jgi:hypothetical protein
VPNKATRAAREAIAMFVDGNAHRLQDWLDSVADGVPEVDANGVQTMDDRGNLRWLVSPNPEKAFALFQSVVEYHVPKLARSELVGGGGGPIGIAALDVKGLTDGELLQMRSLLSKAVPGGEEGGEE